MAIFDSYEGVQVKIGKVSYKKYSVGDDVPLSDGIYFGHEGFFVVYDGLLIAKHGTITNKWDVSIKPSDIPIKRKVQ